MTGSRLLVPVSDSNTIRNTVAYVTREALEASEAGTTDAIHFVYPVSPRVADGVGGEDGTDPDELLERVAVWAENDLGEDAERVAIETALVGTDEYLFSSGDYADVLVRYAREHDLDRAVFDPGYTPFGMMPLLPALEAAVRDAGLPVEQAPVTREQRTVPLLKRGSVRQFPVLFGASYLFYLVLAGSVDTFELATGAISALVVAVVLWRVSLTSSFEPIRGAGQVGRLVLYVPYLLWQVTVANVRLASLVLRPDVQLEPELVEFDAAVASELAVATLANSITLTPGTLTVDATRNHFTIHVLTAKDREGLLEGALERAVRFVFYGRPGVRIPTPAERQGRGEEGS